MGRFAPLLQAEGEGVERITYRFHPQCGPGMLASIYSKPAEFYWQVQRD